jgi:hypothetical protein
MKSSLNLRQLWILDQSIVTAKRFALGLAAEFGLNDQKKLAFTHQMHERQ